MFLKIALSCFSLFRFVYYKCLYLLFFLPKLVPLNKKSFEHNKIPDKIPIIKAIIKWLILLKLFVKILINIKIIAIMKEMYIKSK